jgi:thiol-disulfide isomerase/thioredoxin
MDRLPALILVALACAACDDKKGAPPPSRADVGAATTKQASVEAFCDVYNKGDTGPAFAFPALADGGAAPSVPAGSWHWINVWATWCKPCLEELPRLVAWRGQLGAPIALAFVSIDEKPDAVTAFRAAHPDTPASLRLPDAAARTGWWKALGLDGDPPIPINIFVTPAGKVRCVRAGAIRDADRDAVQRLFAE